MHYRGGVRGGLFGNMLNFPAFHSFFSDFPVSANSHCSLGSFWFSAAFLNPFPVSAAFQKCFPVSADFLNFFGFP